MSSDMLARRIILADMRAYAGIARVPFLLLPITLVASGSAAAAYEGHFNWLHTLVAFVGLVLLHVAVNVLNEVSDARTGIDHHTTPTPYSGGSKTLQSGRLSSSKALLFGLICAAAGLGIGIWFITRIGWGLLPILLIGALFILGYSDVLARMGVGELAAGLGLGGLAVVGAALVQEGIVGRAAIAAALPATFMTFNLLLLNEFPDEEADRTGGRRHLVIIFGRQTAAMIYVIAALLTPISILVCVLLDFLPLPALAAMLPSLLLVRPLRWAFSDPMEEVPVPALGANVFWNLLTNAALALTLVMALL